MMQLWLLAGNPALRLGPQAAAPLERLARPVMQMGGQAGPNGQRPIGFGGSYEDQITSGAGGMSMAPGQVPFSGARGGMGGGAGMQSSMPMQGAMSGGGMPYSGGGPYGGQGGMYGGQGGQGGWG